MCWHLITKILIEIAQGHISLSLSFPIDVGLIPLTKLDDVFTIWSALSVLGMVEDRAWMYNGWSRNGRHSDEWVARPKILWAMLSPCH
jgi:hypothetical protein